MKSLSLLCLLPFVLVACSTTPEAPVDEPVRLSNAVKWHTQSKEYPLISQYLYQQAGDYLKANKDKLPTSNWVVVADVDETLLDNSEYQRRLELQKQGYTSESWANWVIEEDAKAVPGAIEFVKTVLALGGKMALITNRPNDLNQHTWINLNAVGFPITLDNACLLGRTPADKAAVDNVIYINDKDLRREQIIEGTAHCYGDSTKDSFSQPHQIIMQVGDNIEDIRYTTQEDADVDTLLLEQGKSILILPNSLYGSW
jgi:5'-nucleotidase (lipoprotein e(P4) family)